MSATLPAAARDRDQVPDGCPLTRREFEVLQLMGDGLTVKQVAAKHGCRPATIRLQAHTAYRRLGVNDVKQALMVAARAGWFGWAPPPPPPEPQERALSPFLRAYLDAFDEHLRTRSAQSRRSMRIALLGGANDAGRTRLPPPVTDPLASVVDVLAHGRSRGRAEPSPEWPARGRRS